MQILNCPFVNISSFFAYFRLFLTFYLRPSHPAEFAEILKNRTFCKVYFATLFRVMLNNRVLFRNKRYCGVDKIAVILHPIKNALILSIKT